ncbi:50S ribosomal protein L22 [Planctomycetales bacterium ZRK34]|nr:50S ribosomal protein L22 [Planctomycetales bacterium ZRK34]
MAYSSKHRYARISARKARLATGMISGKPIAEARAALKFSKKRSSVLVAKVLESAIANAQDVTEGEIDVRRLVVTEARVDEGPTMKRFQPKDRGRAHPIMKRTSHIVISVDAK